VRELEDRDVVTNHLFGAGASDPKNLAVREKTSSVDREARAKELVASSGDVAGAVALLRDRRGKGGSELARGDRRAIDAEIATHGVVMDPKGRAIWVSEAPHLAGRFVEFRLERELAPNVDPGVRPERRFIPADPR
jgi:hypothetical protein